MDAVEPIRVGGKQRGKGNFMLTWKGWVMGSVLAALLIVSVTVSCSVLKYQFCITNLTSFNLKEVDIVPEGQPSWGVNQLSATLLPGQEQDTPGWAPGTYWVRAIFDVIDPCGNGFCGGLVKSTQQIECTLNEVLVYSFDLPAITTTNLCIDYQERDSTLQPPKAFTCHEIYATSHFAI